MSSITGVVQLITTGKLPSKWVIISVLITELTAGSTAQDLVRFIGGSSKRNELIAHIVDCKNNSPNIIKNWCESIQLKQG